MNPLKSINPSFNSELVSELFNLEKIRYTHLGGTTPPWLFFDLREIMYILESVASARIEGNRTTVVSAAMDSLSNDEKPSDENLQELRNIRKAIDFIEETFDGDDSQQITPSFIREVQKIVVTDLKHDGSKWPGDWRSCSVHIKKSDHEPPNHIEIPRLIQELCDYIADDNDNKMDIIKIALAHHRLAAIHPFDNGNGRTARLVTYAMLIKAKFINKTMRTILNPSAIFCMDRQEYYNKLAAADSGKEEALEDWCLYVARGIASEMVRVNKLLDRNYAVPNIIEPALKSALDSQFISAEEHEILKIAMQKDLIQAQDVRHLFGPTASAAVQTSRVLTNMRDKGLLMVHPDYQKKYVMRFANNYLLRDVLLAMDRNGLLVVKNEATE
ncbi:Fic family protein [Candidatus Saccharibacteria bacterium oral taxon 488]|jgi:hypothetical protein|nr:Fic family protein [Candidatus Saccharibacteria bacterium oral taxon 488]QJU08742.1 Fic family protein [Candidatus Saccharibacteria bacterium oral taxon 488]